MIAARLAALPARLALLAAVLGGCASEPQVAARLSSLPAAASAREAPTSLALTLDVASDGVRVRTRAGDIAAGCEHPGQGVVVPNKGRALDEGALRACVAKLKSAAPEAKNDTSVTISAAPETPYQLLVSTMDAVRKTAAGEVLFPDVTFGLPPSTPLLSPLSGAPSKSAPPAVSVGGAPGSIAGVAVVVSKTNVAVDDIFVAYVPPDPQRGFASDYKRSGRGDLYVVPLGKALKTWRERDMQVSMATGKDPSFSEAIIIADADTPYRLLSEVFFTLQQSDFSKFHLMVTQK